MLHELSVIAFRRHAWTSIGSRLGRTCLHNHIRTKTYNNFGRIFTLRFGENEAFDDSGCLPFTDIIDVYREWADRFIAQSQIFIPLHQQARPGHVPPREPRPQGTWFEPDDNYSDFYRTYGYKPWERAISLLGFLNQEWQDQQTELTFSDYVRSKLNMFFNDDELQILRANPENQMLDLVMHGLSPDQLSCSTVLMGAPGMTIPTVIDVRMDLPLISLSDVFSLACKCKCAYISQKNHVTSSCKVLPISGRLAIQKLAHFQGVRYEDNADNGIQLNNQIYSTESWLDSESLHRICQQKSTAFNSDHGTATGAICYNYPACMEQMLKLVCRENKLCCPSNVVYQACKDQLANNTCQVCQQQIYWYDRFWHALPGNVFSIQGITSKKQPKRERLRQIANDLDDK